jgi:hypothetical protein
MVKRRQRNDPAKPPDPGTPPAWPADRHSGEGSASALEMLQRLEAGRVARQGEDPRDEPAPPRTDDPA